MSNLMTSIKSLYRQITEEELILAEGNLLGLFKVLERIDAGLTQDSKVLQRDQSNGDE